MNPLLAGAVTLLLMVDVSVSVDDDEYATQRDGIAAAFLDPGVQRSVIGAGGACVAYVEWAADQKVVVGWTPLLTAGDMIGFAGRMAAVQRSSRGVTRVDAALNFASSVVGTSPCGGRIVVDVSGDGCQYGAGDTAPALDRLRGLGAQVNGLTILGDPRVAVDCRGMELDDWYRAHVAVDGFVIVADGFDDFRRTLIQKLRMEIAGWRGSKDFAR